jgi:hypothetical protein
MGLLVMTADAPLIDPPYPRSTMLILTCDGGECGLFPTSAEFVHPQGYIAQYRAAMNAGWKDTQGPQGRIFLCPACSGKVRSSSPDD